MFSILDRPARRFLDTFSYLAGYLSSYLPPVRRARQQRFTVARLSADVQRLQHTLDNWAKAFGMLASSRDEAGHLDRLIDTAAEHHEKYRPVIRLQCRGRAGSAELTLAPFEPGPAPGRELAS